MVSKPKSNGPAAPKRPYVRSDGQDKSAAAETMGLETLNINEEHPPPVESSNNAATGKDLAASPNAIEQPQTHKQSPPIVSDSRSAGKRKLADRNDATYPNEDPPASSSRASSSTSPKDDRRASRTIAPKPTSRTSAPGTSASPQSPTVDVSGLRAFRKSLTPRRERSSSSGSDRVVVLTKPQQLYECPYMLPDSEPGLNGLQLTKGAEEELVEIRVGTGPYRVIHAPLQVVQEVPRLKSQLENPKNKDQIITLPWARLAAVELMLRYLISGMPSQAEFDEQNANRFAQAKLFAHGMLLGWAVDVSGFYTACRALLWALLCRCWQMALKRPEASQIAQVVYWELGKSPLRWLVVHIVTCWSFQDWGIDSATGFDCFDDGLKIELRLWESMLIVSNDINDAVEDPQIPVLEAVMKGRIVPSKDDPDWYEDALI